MDKSGKTTVEMTENLALLKNVTIGEICDLPATDYEELVVPEIICDLCKNVSEVENGLTIGEICENDPCHRFPKFCDFCNAINITKSGHTLFTNKSFVLDEMTQQNASKFAIFLEYENPHM